MVIYAVNRPRFGGVELLAGLGVAGPNLEKTTDTKKREEAWEWGKTNDIGMRRR